MFQQFDVTSDPSTANARVEKLRQILLAQDLNGFIIPRGDRFQGEYVAPCDERLAYMTSFTGSAGFAIIQDARAALFVDGRYTIQAGDQIDETLFQILNIPNDPVADWLNSGRDGTIGFDPWLHSHEEIERLTGALRKGIQLSPIKNPVDHIWTDQPDPPKGKATEHPIKYVGKDSASKLSEVGAEISQAGGEHAILTKPESICWLLNIRGQDIPRTPIIHCFAILSKTGHLQLFADPEKLAEIKFGETVTVHNWEAFDAALEALEGPIIIDPKSVPFAVTSILEQASQNIIEADDPCLNPKACKNHTEIKGARIAHHIDGIAICKFLYELSQSDAVTLSEIDAVKMLEGKRKASNQLCDISFETISGSGPNGAIVHYRVNEQTNRRFEADDILLIDSGGQYPEGTTDITRTIALGTPSQEAVQAFTLVLKGMIALSRASFPKGLRGCDLDALARQFLWAEGMDYDHGTGHGVGSYLSVHEGPQGISRHNQVPLECGMILSNEPGYYKTGAFGIRIENLIVVQAGEAEQGRKMLGFETLTLAPIDLALVDSGLLSMDEKNWLNAYHQRVYDQISPDLDQDEEVWLHNVTRAI